MGAMAPAPPPPPPDWHGVLYNAACMVRRYVYSCITKQLERQSGVGDQTSLRSNGLSIPKISHREQLRRMDGHA